LVKTLTKCEQAILMMLMVPDHLRGTDEEGEPVDRISCNLVDDCEDDEVDKALASLRRKKLLAHAPYVLIAADVVYQHYEMKRDDDGCETTLLPRQPAPLQKAPFRLKTLEWPY
jgi:hypothetical protein